MDSIPTPWTVVYSDGSANAFRFNQGDGERPGTVSYDPVTTAQSSSGVYTGGTAQQTALDASAVKRLWQLIEKLEAATDSHSSERLMTTGAFTVTVRGQTSRFVLRPGPLLEVFETFVAPFRGAVDPAELAATSGQVAMVTLVGVAQNAKMGAVLVTDVGEPWIDLQAWPDEADGKKVEVRGHWLFKKDLPVVVAEDGPQKAGIPVPSGTDLDEAARRKVLTDVSWKFIP